MTRSTRLRPGEHRRIHELVAECEERWDDAPAWQAHLLAGTRDLLVGSIAVWVLADGLPTRRTPRVREAACSAADGPTFPAPSPT